ncbi:unnamed protein product [Hyaloperonospora brassicae]|uniref:Uncharacterized protein n=1 Tax=Hyaloperonospora brassicae TaxID=162125 RepID=A0AAV0T2L2_HYABA|nr:unnamed protein product [Hyaloperonospora brassicae]
MDPTRAPEERTRTAHAAVQEQQSPLQMSHCPVDVAVFLGGSCNPTTWRRDIAVPLLTANHVRFFDPQVDEWSPERIAMETRAKERAALVLIVVDGRTRSLVSIHEAVEFVCRGRSVRLVIDDVPSGLVIEGAVVSTAELADLNGARQCLRDVATERRHVKLFPDVAAAVGACSSELLQLNERRQHRRQSGRSMATKPQEDEEEEKNEEKEALIAVDGTRFGGPPWTDLLPRQSYTGGSVYLGGNVGATSWREEVAVPLLRRAGIAVHVPAVDYWQLGVPSGANTPRRRSRTDSLHDVKQLRATSALVLFVIPKHLRAIAAMTEAVALVLSRDAVVLVVEPVEEGDMIEEGVALTGRELHDLTRARAYLRDMAERNNVAVFPSVTNAVDAIIAMVA